MINQKITPRHNSISGFAHILLPVIVVIAVGAGGYWLWKNDKLNIAVDGPTPTPTQEKTVQNINVSDWKTYNNEKYGFSFRYPADWISGEETRSDNPLIYIVYLRPENPTPGDPTSGLVNVHVYDTNLSLDNFINTILCHSPGDCASSDDAIETTLSGLPAKKLINRPSLIDNEITLIKSNYIIGVQINLDDA